MKKLFWSVAIVCVAMLCMTSCSNKERCWKGKITFQLTYDDGEKESDKMTLYTWGTEDEVTAALDDYVKEIEEYFSDEGKCKVSYTIEKYKASESDCEDKDDFIEVDDMEF